MDTVELGGSRLHALVVTPGLPGEADRIAAKLATLDPAMLLLDASTNDALRMRSPDYEPGFVDALFMDEVQARFGRGDRAGEHPLVAAARAAQRQRATLVVLRPTTKEPGFFSRKFMARDAARITAPTPTDFAERYAALVPHGDAPSAAPRVERALREGRAPVVAVLQAHRAAATLAEVRALGRVAP